jgi:hypothetical protein
VIIAMSSACHKKDRAAKGGNQTGQSGDAVIVDTQNLDLVTETEAKEREDFKANIRSLTLKGDFSQLESLAKDFRENKSQFRDGCSKLRVFYTAFGYLPDDASDSDWKTLIKQDEQWAKAYPKSVAPKIALAETFGGYAWVARTSQTADKVTDEGWRLMNERLGKAFQSLQAGSKLEQKCPGWYGTALKSALGSQMERSAYEKLFEKAVKAAPDYAAIYDYKAYYLLSRWYGKEGEWESFAISMMKRSDIPDCKEIFARAAMYLRDMGCFYNEFSGSDQSWDSLKESFRELEKHYPDSLEIKSAFCIISAKLYDYKEARTQMKMTGNKVDLSVWAKKENFVTAVNWLKKDDAGLEQSKQDWKKSKGQ